jgi:hypothetical protein
MSHKILNKDPFYFALSSTTPKVQLENAKQQHPHKVLGIRMRCIEEGKWSLSSVSAGESVEELSRTGFVTAHLL